jgi:hypothetical protein
MRVPGETEIELFVDGVLRKSKVNRRPLFVQTAEIPANSVVPAFAVSVTYRKQEKVEKSGLDCLWGWSGRVDSNHRPPGPEPGALARLSHAPKNTTLSLFPLVCFAYRRYTGWRQLVNLEPEPFHCRHQLIGLLQTLRLGDVAIGSGLIGPLHVGGCRGVG